MEAFVVLALAFWVQMIDAAAKKILIMKMRYIGDTVLVTPLIRAFKAARPEIEIHLLVNGDTAGIVRGCRQIDRVLAFDYERSKKDFLYVASFVLKLWKARFDTVIDLTGNDRSALLSFVSGASRKIGYEGGSWLHRKVYTHQVPYRFGEIHTVDHHLDIARFLGLPAGDPHPELTVADTDKHRMRRVLENYGLPSATPYVIVHPGARRWYKSWPLDRFARIADAILAHYPVALVLAGGPGDKTACDAIASQMKSRAVNVCGCLSLEQLPALICQGILLLGNDSAPIHIATAVKTPAVALFGPTRWEDWQPRRPHDHIHYAAFPCRPCGHARADCPLGDAYCMSEITVDAVWHTIESVLKKTGFSPSQ